jgi:hypothetical protein
MSSIVGIGNKNEKRKTTMEDNKLDSDGCLSKQTILKHVRSDIIQSDIKQSLTTLRQGELVSFYAFADLVESEITSDQTLKDLFWNVVCQNTKEFFSRVLYICDMFYMDYPFCQFSIGLEDVMSCLSFSTKKRIRHLQILIQTHKDVFIDMDRFGFIDTDEIRTDFKDLDVVIIKSAMFAKIMRKQLHGLEFEANKRVIYKHKSIKNIDYSMLDAVNIPFSDGEMSKLSRTSNYILETHGDHIKYIFTRGERIDDLIDENQQLAVIRMYLDMKTMKFYTTPIALYDNLQKSLLFSDFQSINRKTLLSNFCGEDSFSMYAYKPSIITSIKDISIHQGVPQWNHYTSIWPDALPDLACMAIGNNAYRYRLSLHHITHPLILDNCIDTTEKVYNYLSNECVLGCGNYFELTIAKKIIVHAKALFLK